MKKKPYTIPLSDLLAEADRCSKEMDKPSASKLHRLTRKAKELMRIANVPCGTF